MNNLRNLLSTLDSSVITQHSSLLHSTQYSALNMRILVITNHYPPHFIGGYELGCKDVVERLEVRGHQIAVLTSTFGLARPEQSGSVYRWLETSDTLEVNGSPTGLMRLFKKESINRKAFDRVCREFKPDLVYVWNAAKLSISIALRAQEIGLPVSYFISDDWLTRWESDEFYSLRRKVPRRAHRRAMWKSIVAFLDASGVLPRDKLELGHVQFASDFLKRAALEASADVADAAVIHWGVDLRKFSFNDRRRAPSKLLYVGQLTDHKGVGTALEAFKLIAEQPRYNNLRLTIVGGPDYGDRFHRMASELHLGEKVRFTGLIQRDHLPAIYRDHDILLFPSAWDEPFSIALVEAMASGLAIVGTSTGGSSEILEDEVNALVFPRSDAETCASQVTRLLRDVSRFETLRRNARETVEGRFGIEKMVDRIELALKKQIGTPAVAAAARAAKS